jgi:hypothetical protein
MKFGLTRKELVKVLQEPSKPNSRRRTMDKTIDMAREAGWDDHHAEFDTRIDRLVALVRADEREQGQKWFDAVTAQHKQEILAEREACAKLAQSTVCDTHIPTGVKIYGTAAAKAIRARGETK